MARSNSRTARRLPRAGEAGFALVALLTLMTLIALALTAAAPSIKQQNQRSCEQEAIARGEEVAHAIHLYVRARQTLPTSIEQLLEGIPHGTKKIQILRPSAARDSLSQSGEWRLVRNTDAVFTHFQRNVALYAGGAPPVRDEFFRKYAADVSVIINTKVEDVVPPGGEDEAPNSIGGFVGVASRSRRASVLTYYGIERHNEWVFTPLFN